MPAGTINMTAATESRPVLSSFTPFKMSKVINFADLQLKKGAALETNEVIQVFSIPAKTFVEKVFVEILTAGVGTGSLLATVGDGTDPNGFDTSVDLEATAGTVTFNGVASVTGTGAANTDGTANVLTDAYAAGCVYTAADTLDLVLIDYDAVTVHPVIKVTALCADLSV